MPVFWAADRSGTLEVTFLAVDLLGPPDWARVTGKQEVIPLFRIRRLVVGGRDFFGHLPVSASFADKCPAGFCVVIHPDEIAVNQDFAAFSSRSRESNLFAGSTTNPNRP